MADLTNIDKAALILETRLRKFDREWLYIKMGEPDVSNPEAWANNLLSKMAQEGLVTRVSRGIYVPNHAALAVRICHMKERDA